MPRGTLEGVTPLSAIALVGEAGMVRALLDNGTDFNEGDDSWTTALSWASIGNEINVAEQPIRPGADVNHLDKGMTPLLYADYSRKVIAAGTEEVSYTRFPDVHFEA